MMVMHVDSQVSVFLQLKPEIGKCYEQKVTSQTGTRFLLNQARVLSRFCRGGTASDLQLPTFCLLHSPSSSTAGLVSRM